MTIREAIDQRVPRVRIAYWNKEAYLRLPLLENSMHGPWCQLIDPASQAVVGYDQILVTQLINDCCSEYEPYLGPKHENEHALYVET